MKFMWQRTVAAGRLGKLDAFGVFTFTANREQVIPLSVKPGGEANILVEVALGVKMNRP